MAQSRLAVDESFCMGFEASEAVSIGHPVVVAIVVFGVTDRDRPQSLVDCRRRVSCHRDSPACVCVPSDDSALEYLVSDISYSRCSGDRI